MSTRTVLDENLREIRDDILRLGSLVSKATEQATDAFRNNDTNLAEKIVAEDDQIDSLHHRLEGVITNTIALQQPMAHDLRNLIAALLITNELERMGDHAEGIARTVLREGTISEVPSSIIEMKDKVTAMIRASMDAFLQESPPDARAVAASDHDVDALYRQLFDAVVKRMGSGELPVEQGTYLLWAGHNLERIADRVTNICERVVYSATGELGGLNPRGEKQEQ